LKSLIPQLAHILGVTPAALYERQRALVRANLMESRAGRGPGSGVRATSKSISLLLISLLATDSLSETEELTKIFTRLRSTKGACPFTGKRTFGSAVAAVFESEDLLLRAGSITVYRTAAQTQPRTEPQAQIHFSGDPFGNNTSVFGYKHADIGLRRKLYVQATFIMPVELKFPA
jgi:hypothetical protein